MATAQSAPTSRFMQLLSTPWVDKTIAIVAITPNVIELYHRYTDANLSFVRAVAGIQTIILVIMMAFRRTPVRVTPNPWYWLLAFVATYGLIAFYAFAPRGMPIVPVIVPNVLVLVSVAIMIYDAPEPRPQHRLCSGDRGIVTEAVPTGLCVIQSTLAYSSRCSAFLLRAYLPLNLLLVAVIAEALHAQERDRRALSTGQPRLRGLHEAGALSLDTGRCIVRRPPVRR